MNLLAETFATLSRTTGPLHGVTMLDLTAGDRTPDPDRQVNMQSSVIFEIGQRLSERTYAPGAVQLFPYNAAIWNAHRIRYDLPHTQNVEGHPGLLIEGPLQGDWLPQWVYDWMDVGDDMLAFSYSNRRAAYVGDVLTASGEITAIVGDQITLKLQLSNQHGQATYLDQATLASALLGRVAATH
ncbi:TPA: hypothetical protein ONA18_005126 [Pseudomonas aeruginosa]|nr:hypothetical protein [Pseudomonas aeruginosa]